MAFKSEAQRKKFKKLLADGKITQKVYDAFEEETGDKKLHDRVLAPPSKVGKIKKTKVIK